MQGQVLVTLLATGIGGTAMEYTMDQVVRQKAVEQAEEIHLEQEMPAFSFDPVEKQLDDLEVPAFIRRGYNQIENSVYQHE